MISDTNKLKSSILVSIFLIYDSFFNFNSNGFFIAYLDCCRVVLAKLDYVIS